MEEMAVVDGEVVLLQARPVTTVIRRAPAGPVFGPGPVAETFPEPLAPLEIDLWVPPLRDGAAEALRISGAVSRSTIDDRDLVIVVGGRGGDGSLRSPGETAALVGAPARGLALGCAAQSSAWRIGRLRVALPLIAEGLASMSIGDSEAVPAFSEFPPVSWSPSSNGVAPLCGACTPTRS